MAKNQKILVKIAAIRGKKVSKIFIICQDFSLENYFQCRGKTA
jgi:hypothetical protein